jgi:1,4-dihydroxy-2-naphthoate polyprenyltransferase
LSNSHIEPAIWVKALRVPFLTATIIPILLGTIVAWWTTGSFHGWRFLAILISISLIHLGANLSNDYFDFLSSNDIINKDFNAFSGGSRVLADALIPPGQVFSAALALFGTGTLMGLSLAWMTDSLVLAVLVLCGLFAGYAYTGTPFKLAYRGFGELLNVLVFGPLIVLIASAAQGAPLSMTVLIASVPPGVLLGLLLLINEFPDCEADAGCSKKTLVVRLGKENAIHLYHAVLVSVYLYLIVALIASAVPYPVLLPLLTLPLGVTIIIRSRRHLHDAKQLEAANMLTYQLHSIFGILLCMGYLLDGLF